MNLLRASANRLSACGRALRPWLWRTLLPAAGLDPSGQASPAERQPCRTAGARFTAAIVLGRGRRGGYSGASEQGGSTATTHPKPRRERHALRGQSLRAAMLRCVGHCRKPEGTYIVEFRIANGEALAISVPAGGGLRLCDKDWNLTFCARLIIRIRRVCRYG